MENIHHLRIWPGVVRSKTSVNVLRQGHVGWHLENTGAVNFLSKMVEEQATDPKPSPSLLCQSALRLVLDESIENLGKLYSEAKWVDPRNSPYYIYVMFILLICLYLY